MWRELQKPRKRLTPEPEPVELKIVALIENFFLS